MGEDATESTARFAGKSRLPARHAAGSVLQVRGKELVDAPQGVGSILGAVTGLVVGILEGVTRIGVDFGVDGFAERFHGRFEVMDGLGGDALVLAAEVAEDGGVDPGELRLVSGQRAVVDGNGLERWGGDGEL